MGKYLFDRYIWLVDTIYRAEKITFEEINAKWQNSQWSNGKDLALKTFHNHKNAIQDLFDINIECDRKNNYVYYIENKEDIENERMRAWLLNTFSVNNLINESHHLKQRILFEEIPSGQHFLTPVIEAMRDGLSLEIKYRSFWRDKANSFEIEPFCVKIFKQRWYVVARSPFYDDIRIYALDRILELTSTENSFQLPKDFNPETFFENHFGITVSSVEPCPVRIKVFGQQRNYLQTLPLHVSQVETETSDDYSIFSYFISPTVDFKQELLMHGSDVEVIAPDWFRADIAETVQKMNERYR